MKQRTQCSGKNDSAAPRFPSPTTSVWATVFCGMFPAIAENNTRATAYKNTHTHAHTHGRTLILIINHIRCFFTKETQWPHFEILLKIMSFLLCTSWFKSPLELSVTMVLFLDTSAWLWLWTKDTWMTHEASLSGTLWLTLITALFDLSFHVFTLQVCVSKRFK